MQRSLRIAAIAAVLLCATLPASGADEPRACVSDPNAAGLSERIAQMSDHMDRVERATDRAEQRRLLDLHTKKMHEGMRQLRHRGAGEGCRLEMMQAMLEQMMRHQLVERDAAAR